MISGWYAVPAALALLCVASYIWTKVTRPGLKLAGKHVFITGGSSGLGLATAKLYAEAGAKVSIVARSQSKLDIAKAEIEEVKTGESQVFTYSVDVTNYQSVKEAVSAANKFHEQAIDHVIACAGIAHPGYILDQDISYFHKSMDLNLFGVVHAIKAALPSMIEAKTQGKKIVIVSSACGLLSFIGYTQYSATKYALRGLAEALRNEMIMYNIDVHIFYPGNIDTPGYVEENRAKPIETREIEGADTPQKPDKVAKALLNGMKNGYFSITNDPILYLLRLLSNGINPRVNTFMEILLFPIAELIARGFSFYMDMVVKKARKTKLKEKNL